MAEQGPGSLFSLRLLTRSAFTALRVAFMQAQAQHGHGRGPWPCQGRTEDVGSLGVRAAELD